MLKPTSSKPRAVEPGTGSARTLGMILAAWMLLAGYMLLREHAEVVRGFGDTDDATRMTMVRDLMHGRGWFDQRLVRFQPPAGVYMHWSRLLDGALAAVDGLVSAVFGAGRGELLTRLLWPLLLLGPALAAGVAITCDLAASEAAQRDAPLAMLVAAVASTPIYAQFHPGRIDHHNVQILMWLIAYAGAAQPGWAVRGAAIAGVATGLGLAVGLEAAPFEAAIAAFLAGRFVMDGRHAPRLRAFSLCLSGTTAVAFLAQTPPDRWGAPVCDALAINMMVGVGVGGIALALCSLAEAARPAVRLALVTAAALAAALAYVGLNPHCLHGPFAEVDMTIKPIWLAHVQEMQSLPTLFRHDLPTAVTLAATMLFGMGAWAVAGLSAERRRTPVYWLAGLMLAMAVLNAWTMLRAASYLAWAALPPLAVVGGALARRLSRGGPVQVQRLGLAALAVTPTVAASILLLSLRLVASPAHAASLKSSTPSGDCFAQADFHRLAALPAGLVLAEQDLGPYVVAYTPSSAMSAPYHRMAYGLLAAHAELTGPSAASALSAARAQGVRYLVQCRAHEHLSDRLPPGSLAVRLAAGRLPPGVQRLSAPHEALQVFSLSR